jgi:hypothetical protein
MAQRTLKNSLDKTDPRFRDYKSLSAFADDVKLMPYETTTVLARSILDAASEEENASLCARPHVAIPVSRGGVVFVQRVGEETFCHVTKVKDKRYKKTIEYGSCSIYDPDGKIYESAKSAVDYVTSIFQQYGGR